MHLNIRTAARRIAFGRFVNSGHICTAPDHVLVWPEVKDELVAELTQQLVHAQPADRRRRNRGDRRRGHAGMHPADSRARSALHGDRHRLPAADRDAPGGRTACFFCSPTVAAASASQPGGTPAWGWAAIAAAFAVLAAGAVLFFRRRYARS